MANGLNIPNNLYTAGAVEFDSRPSTNLFIQYQRQKQARDEALDNYERARIDRINELGLRDQDREGLDNIMLGIKQYYQGNKDAIRRGNTPQNYEYEKMMRDAKNYIGESKERTSKSLAMEKYRQERLKQGRSTTEDFWKDYQAHEMPIRSEGSQSMQLEKYLSQQAPKYDQSKTLKLFSDIKRTPGQPTYKPLAGRPFFNQEIIEERFDENAKGNIAVRAAEAYDSDDGFAYEVQQDYNNPVKRGQLEKIFTEEFQTAPQSMSDFATAKVISQLQPVVTKTKDVRDDKAYQEFMDKKKKENIRLSAALRPNNWIVAGGSATDGATGNEIDRTELELPSQDYSGDWVITGQNIPKQTRAIIKSGGVELSANRPYRLKIENGQIKEVRSVDDKELILTRDDVEKAQKKYDTERKGEGQKFGVGGKQPTYTIKGKNYTEAELIKMGYTKEQIAPYKQK